MKKAKVLFVSQEIFPYTEETPMSKKARFLPQGIQERGKEIRTFMPRFGLINERRNQLHEVIRLSGMNIIMDNNDHPLIIKVASIQSARMQVYFIDNEDYFQRKTMAYDKDGNFYQDNDERTVFFARGVIETVRKLGWAPDIIHCHGWMSSILPMIVKKALKDDPLFAESKIVVSLYDDDFPGNFQPSFSKKIVMEGIGKSDVEHLANTDYVTLMKNAMNFADGIVLAASAVNADLETYAKSIEKPLLSYQDPESYHDAYNEFYDEVLLGVTELA
jgi:starch synthase